MELSNLVAHIYEYWGRHWPSQLRLLAESDARLLAERAAARFLDLEWLLRDGELTGASAATTASGLEGLSGKEFAEALVAALEDEGCEIDRSTPPSPRDPEDAVRDRWRAHWPRTYLALSDNGSAQSERAILIAALKVHIRYRELHAGGATPEAALRRALEEAGAPPTPLRDPADAQDHQTRRELLEMHRMAAVVESKRDAERRLLASYAQQPAEAVSKRVIAVLRTLTGIELPRQYVSLSNAWDAICAHVQGGQAPLPPVLVDAVRAAATRELEHLSTRDLEAVWLQTDRGRQWSRDDSEPYEFVPTSTDDVVRHVLAKVLERAFGTTNARIRRFLDQDSPPS